MWSRVPITAAADKRENTESVKTHCSIMIFNTERYYNRALTFVKDSPDTFLLRQEPAVQTRDLLQVSTRANEKKPEYKNAVERVHCE